MTDKPLSIAISAVIQDNKILLIKRARGDYLGLWSLPGGKIESAFSTRVFTGGLHQHRH